MLGNVVLATWYVFFYFFIFSGRQGCLFDWLKGVAFICLRSFRVSRLSSSECTGQARPEEEMNDMVYLIALLDHVL